ncbi:MAG: phospho-N-acetylmuramoyl-pentapeptide-transferase [Saprospiraceae bacterium]|nr:phospho-N-acetylmuramoyl-pentapeptide-transferase [Saprospiraceae bacterium]
MFYHLFQYLQDEFDFPGASLFQYISFRAGIAIIASLMISILFGGRIIRYLQTKQVGESVRDLGLHGQLEKQGTPTMGGIIIILATLVPCVLLARLDNIYIVLMIIVTVWMAAIGFADDYIKVFRKNKKGLRGKFKIVGQVGLGLIVGLVMLLHDDVVVRMDESYAKEKGYEIVQKLSPVESAVPGQVVSMVYVKTTVTNLPFIKGNNFDYTYFLSFLGERAKTWVWVLFLPLIILIVISVSNGSNLTDGIDGLATGVSAIVGGTLGILAYVSSHTLFADYLNILYLPYTSELVVFSACFIGACIGFLWYNAYPAKVFMGDTGSLTIGGIIATLAIVLRKELLIPILCGVFLMENLSVVLQVGYFKYTRRKYGEGKRIFKMAPLHHHYQKLGMHESKIVTRFLIVGVLLAVFTIITLKIR